MKQSAKLGLNCKLGAIVGPTFICGIYDMPPLPVARLGKATGKPTLSQRVIAFAKRLLQCFA